MPPKSGKTQAPHRAAALRARHSLLKAASNPDLSLRERRKTLHTISELSASNVTLPDWNGSLGGVNGNSIANGSLDGSLASKSLKKSWTRSLPSQGLGSEHSLSTKPSILVTPADAASFQHSLTEPAQVAPCANCGSSAGSREPGNHNPKRHSINSSLRNRLSQVQLSPVVEGEQSNPVSSLPAELARNGSQTKQSIRLGNEKVRQGEGWNARREKERKKLEQAIAEAKARRERGGREIVTGSPSALLSLSPLPAAKPGETHIKRHDSKHQLSQVSQASNNNRVPNPLVRRASASQMERQSAGNLPNGCMLKRASTGDYSHVATHRNDIQRSLSAKYNPTRAPLTTLYPPMPQLIRSASSRSFSSLIPPNQYPPSQTPSSRSLRPSPDSARRSSKHADVPGKTWPSSSHANPASRTPGNQVQHNVTKGRLEHFPTLTNTTTPNARPRSFAQPVSGNQQTATAVEIEGASQASQSPSRYRSNSQSSRRSSTVLFQAVKNTHGTVNRENPTNRDLTPRPKSVSLLEEREKLIQWRAGNEKAELEKNAREKIKERVRRANELEQEKEKELMKEQRKNERSLFCGLFGKA